MFMPRRARLRRGLLIFGVLASAAAVTAVALGRFTTDASLDLGPRPSASAWAAPPRLVWSPAPAAVPVDAAVSLNLARKMTSPACILGPAALCDALAEATAACVGGDRAACLAAARHVDRQPPYSSATVLLYGAACRLGDAEGCAAIAGDAPLDCAVDIGRCTVAARKDRAVLVSLCERGGADACAMVASLAWETPTGDAYMIASCQRGGMPACAEAARRYARRDPVLAGIAAEVACEAGFDEACLGTRR